MVSKKPSPWQKKQEKTKVIVTSVKEVEECLKYIKTVLEMHPVNMANQFQTYYNNLFHSIEIETEKETFEGAIEEFKQYIKLYKKNLTLDNWVRSIGKEEMLVQVTEMIAKLNYVQHEINTPVESL